MNQLFFVFDNTYFLIARFYKKEAYENTKEFGGILVLSLLQSFNIVSIINFVKINELYVFSHHSFSSRIALLLIIALLNFLRYLWYCRYSKLKQTWIKLNKKNKNIRIIITLLYIVFSGALLLFSIY